MSILKMKNHGTQHALKYPLLQGKKMIGRGWSCAVFDNGETVLKLTLDAKQYAFYTEHCTPKGVMFPTLIENHGDVGSQHEHTLFLVEMEKLTPIKRKADAPAAWDLRRKILKAYEEGRLEHCMKYDNMRPSDYHRMVSAAALHHASENESLPEDVRDAIAAVGSFVCDYASCGDFKRDNFMLRGTQLVMNDVVSDIDVVSAHKSRRVVHGWAA